MEIIFQLFPVPPTFPFKTKTSLPDILNYLLLPNPDFSATPVPLLFFHPILDTALTFTKLLMNSWPLWFSPQSSLALKQVKQVRLCLILEEYFKTLILGCRGHSEGQTLRVEHSLAVSVLGISAQMGFFWAVRCPHSGVQCVVTWAVFVELMLL